MILSGGLRTAVEARAAYAESDADAVMVARGALGYPWIFEELTSRRVESPEADEVIAELLWVIDRAEEHWGRSARRATSASSIRPTWRPWACGGPPRTRSCACLRWTTSGTPSALSANPRPSPPEPLFARARAPL